MAAKPQPSHSVTPPAEKKKKWGEKMERTGVRVLMGWVGIKTGRALTSCGPKRPYLGKVSLIYCQFMFLCYSPKLHSVPQQCPSMRPLEPDGTIWNWLEPAGAGQNQLKPPVSVMGQPWPLLTTILAGPDLHRAMDTNCSSIALLQLIIISNQP